MRPIVQKLPSPFSKIVTRTLSAGITAILVGIPFLVGAQSAEDGDDQWPKYVYAGDAGRVWCGKILDAKILMRSDKQKRKSESASNKSGSGINSIGETGDLSLDSGSSDSKEKKEIENAVQKYDLDELLLEGMFSDPDRKYEPAITQTLPPEGKAFLILKITLDEDRSIGKYDYKIMCGGETYKCKAMTRGSKKPFDPRNWQYSGGVKPVRLLYTIDAIESTTAITLIPQFDLPLEQPKISFTIKKQEKPEEKPSEEEKEQKEKAEEGKEKTESDKETDEKDSSSESDKSKEDASSQEGEGTESSEETEEKSGDSSEDSGKSSSKKENQPKSMGKKVMQDMKKDEE